LVDTYLMPTARAVYDLVGSNAEKNVIDRITAYLKNHNGKATKREIMHTIKIKSADFKAYLDTMKFIILIMSIFTIILIYKIDGSHHLIND